MTNEEIEKTAKEIANELVRYCDRTPDDETFVAERLHSLISQAYEEAAATQCEGCRSSIPIDPNGDWKYPRHLGPDTARLPCAAYAIRALNDSLKPVEVE